ncbi:PorT family protein [Reichenbachiella agarivorans]|uniref:PorT family protein n=1 Tax=Reichenbachiella agarivorans TaxID=2979464 RepID=A0ABY6CMZ7_9BACT|nr:PorT family protein [Reichenbachiella agarivorans]UXP31857.1 PorT family protein [Reichenbachiella agarivorans]
MRIKNKLVLVMCVMMWSTSGYAQFWFGPKVGGQLLTPRYQEEARKDSFNTTSKVNWHAGIALDYSTKNNFEVHTELTYVRVNNRSRSTSAYETSLSAGGLGGQYVDSKTTNHFISAPLMARLVFFKDSKIMLMAQVGPRLSYWLGGTGNLRTDELQENDRDEIKYDVKFMDLTQEELVEANEPNKFIVSKPNRLQYALDFGFGTIFEFSPTSRLILDAKYSFGHSNMAFNEGNKLDGGGLYKEDLEYRTNMLVVSVAYMYGYDVMLRRKGKSTMKVKYKRK